MAVREPPEQPERELDDAHFRAIAEFTYDWETWVGPEGDVRWVNPAVERITGYSVAECLQLPSYPLGLVYEDDREGVRQVLEKARAGEPGNHYEFRVRRKDGAVVWAAISWQPLASARGVNLGYRSSVRDIHERKQLEDRLRDALVQAESANRAKSEFLANVSHELRTPLQSILGYAQLLGSANLEPRLAGYVDVLLEQGELLDRLVRDLLDYSSLQAGLLPLRSEPYEPRAVVLGVVRALTPLAHQKGLALELGLLKAPELCLGDPARVSQVLNNLLTNALKFTDQGRITVALDTDGAGFTVSVDDSGPGMPDDDALFAPFRQAQSARVRGGVGLGLAISRQLCERMGGSLVAAKSASHGGARFVASFPGRVASEAARAIEHFLPGDTRAHIDRGFAALHPLGILVIDDMEAAREFMRAALEALGYEVALAASAEEGFQLADARHYDLVLMDIQMPGIDGWSAAQRLRTRFGERPFLVALTANALANDDAQLSAAGFDGFAQKPLRLTELQRLLQRAHERRSATPASELDAERWRELAEIEVGGESLLERMLDRVLGALPPARERAAEARATAQRGALARALHDLLGLCSLIGATRAAKRLAAAEPAAERGELAESAWTDLQRHLDTVHDELARSARGLRAGRHIQHVAAPGSEAARAPDQRQPDPER